VLLVVWWPDGLVILGLLRRWVVVERSAVGSSWTGWVWVGVVIENSGVSETEIFFAEIVVVNIIDESCWSEKNFCCCLGLSGRGVSPQTRPKEILELS